MKDGRIEQTNFHNHPEPQDGADAESRDRAGAIRGLRGGVGEPTIAVAAPAVLNAIFSDRQAHPQPAAEGISSQGVTLRSFSGVCRHALSRFVSAPMVAPPAASDRSGRRGMVAGDATAGKSLRLARMNAGPLTRPLEAPNRGAHWWRSGR